MAFPVWLSSLPQKVSTQGYQEQSIDTLLRTKMDAGIEKVRRRNTVVTQKFTWQFEMTQQQVADFEDFFVNTLEAGSVPFQFAHPRTGVTKNWRFRGPPTISPLQNSGVWFIVNCEVELLP